MHSNLRAEACVCGPECSPGEKPILLGKKTWTTVGPSMTGPGCPGQSAMCMWQGMLGETAWRGAEVTYQGS